MKANPFWYAMTPMSFITSTTFDVPIGYPNDAMDVNEALDRYYLFDWVSHCSCILLKCYRRASGRSAYSFGFLFVI